MTMNCFVAAMQVSLSFFAESPSHNYRIQQNFDVHRQIGIELIEFSYLSSVQWEQNEGQCGVCGDPYNFKSPRPHEAGGEFAKGIISRFYTAGQVSIVAH